jgi:hypothetical protein
MCDYTSEAFPSKNNVATPRAVLRAFVCDGKISFIVEVKFVMHVLNVTSIILLCI